MQRQVLNAVSLRLPSFLNTEDLPPSPASATLEFLSPEVQSEACSLYQGVDSAHQTLPGETGLRPSLCPGDFRDTSSAGAEVQRSR